MPAETQRLLSAAERMAALTDTLSATFAAELAEVLRQTERRLVTLLRQLEIDRASRVTRQAEVARLATLRDQIREALRGSGYDGLAETATSSAFERMVATARASRAGSAAARFFTPLFGQRVDALRVLAASDLLHQGEVITQALYRVVRDGVLGGAPAPVLLERLAETLDREVSEVRTLYDTATATFGRVMEQQASEGAADELFLYAGPVDAKMRPFCADQIGKVYTREAIGQLDNGQRLDVLLTCGGWNCRHVWMRLSRFSELADIANTGERAPEVKALMRRRPMPKPPIKRPRAA